MPKTSYDGKIVADPVIHDDGSVALHRGWIELLFDTQGAPVAVLSMWEQARPEDQNLSGPTIIERPS